MNDAIKARIGIVYNVVEATILAIAVGLTTWTATSVIEHTRQIAVEQTKTEAVSLRVDKIETKGSSSLEAFEKESQAKDAAVNARLEKLEMAVISLQSAPGELKAIAARLDSLKEGQARIENALEVHLRNGRTNP